MISIIVAEVRNKYQFNQKIEKIQSLLMGFSFEDLQVNTADLINVRKV